MVAAVVHRTKRVEFVGLPSPFNDPAVVAMKARGQLTPKRHKALWGMESKRQMQGFCRYFGVTINTVGIANGLSRDYTFGPREFVVEMDVDDIAILHGQHPANPQAFRLLDELVVVSR